MDRLAALGLAAFALLYGVPVSAAAGDALPVAVASVSAETPISAGGGWLLWSVPANGGWRLEAYHDGRVEALAVPARRAPFDVSVGTNAQGAAVATFSRCARTPIMRDVGETQAIGGSLMDPRTGAGCRLRVLALASGRESQPRIPHPRGSSDTTPSMWHGSIAFARRAPGHGEVWQVMLWSPRHPRSVATLRHGAIPSHCPFEPGGCSARPAYGEVEALDRDGGLVTFLWAVEGPGVAGEGAWEVRVDNLANGRSRLAEAGFGHEACTGPANGLEYVWPEAPIADGALVLFPPLVGFNCFRSFASVLGGYRPGARHASAGEFADVVLGMARDGDSFYGLVPPPAQRDADSPSCSATEPCTLEQISEPALTVEKPSPVSPFLQSQ